MRKPKLLEDYNTLPYDTVSLFAHSAIRQTTSSPFIANGGSLLQALQAAVAALDTWGGRVPVDSELR